jgi:hypothetical protein
MDILITQTPSGEAPEWVRQAWVGLNLPVAGSGPEAELTSGVLTGPGNPLERLLALITGKLKFNRGYPVYTANALAILEQHRPDAAAWWRDNAPNVLEPNRRFVFHADCCSDGTAAA